MIDLPLLPPPYIGTVDESRCEPGSCRGLGARLATSTSRAPVLPHEERVGSPLLVVDLYWQDLAGHPPWPHLISLRAGRHGCILKATQGTRYYDAALSWFGHAWRALGPTANPRHGRSFVRGAYHYLEFTQSGRKQAEYYLRVVNGAGGFLARDVMPVLDVEFGGLKAANRKASRQQVVDSASEWSETVSRETGRPIVLYGGSALEELRIKDRLGCSWIWPAAYAKQLKRREYEAIGWTVDKVLLWQYTDGDYSTAVTKRGHVLPRTVPGFGAVDCSVFVPRADFVSDFARIMSGGEP